MSGTVLKSLHRRLIQTRGSASVNCAGFDAQFRVRSKPEYKTVCGGLFERDAIEVFLKALNADDIVYEIGGHIGSWTVFIGQHCHQGQVAVFEPDANNASANRHNIKLNELSNVSVIQKAASNQNGVARLNTDSNTTTGIHSLIRQTQKSEGVEVETIRLDEVPDSHQLPTPTAMKIDCEGAELMVIEGAENLLAKTRVVMIETHGDILKQAGSSTEAVLQKLKETGLKIAQSWPGDNVGRYLLVRP